MRQFHELFAGRDDAYGTYSVSRASKSTKKGQKRTGRARTITNTELTKEIYDKHISGEQGLGVVPIRLDGTVMWFAIDVDNYVDEGLHEKLAIKINKLNLPLLIFSTKSGGAHLFCFLTEPAEAADVRKHAEKYLAALGLPKKTEIFPKQEAILKSDGGSWINLPYMDGTRPCLGVDGRTKLSLKEFLLLAAEREVHPSDLGFRTKELDHHDTNTDADVDGGAPPCIVTMLNDGIEEGGRDNALTHVAVFLKRAHPDDWQDRLMEINDESAHPSLTTSEMFRIIKSAERKDYQYLCKQTPMIGICDKSTCLKRKFGVGDGEGDFANFIIDSIRKVGIEDPYYVVVVDGLQIRLTSVDLLQFSKFRRAVFEKLNKIIPPMKPAPWEKMLAALMIDMEIEEAPEEISTSGAIMTLFMDWTAQRLHGVVGVRDRIGDGQPFYSKEDHFILFRGTDFLSYVRRNANKIIDDRIIWLTLQEEGAEQMRELVNGRNVRIWKFPVGTEPWFNVEERDEGAF